MRIEIKAAVVLIVIIVAVSTLVSIILIGTVQVRQVTKCNDSHDWGDFVVYDLEYDGSYCLYLTNGQRIICYDLLSKNVTDDQIVDVGVPVPVVDMAALNTLSVYLIPSFQSNQLMWYSEGNFGNITVEGVSENVDLTVIADDKDRNTLFIGGTDTGVIIYDRNLRTFSNLTTLDGLVSNQILSLHARASLLFIAVTGGLHVYDLATDTLYNVTKVSDFRITSFEYFAGTRDAFVGTENDGIHVYRWGEDEWVHIRPIGPSDKLPSASVEDLELDVTSHKLIVSTPLGICTIDLYDYEVDVLEETQGTLYRPTGLYHEYNGPVCYIYFGTTGRGLWQILVDYAAPEPVDYGPVLFQLGITVLAILGGGLVSIVVLILERWFKLRDVED